MSGILPWLCGRNLQKIRIRFLSCLCGGFGMGHIGWEWKASFSLQSVTGQEKIYIYKPWKAIFRTFFYYYAFFAFLTLLSFNVLALVLIPAWFMLLYQFFIALKWMENFNISKVKTTVYSALIETGFVAAAPYVRKFL